MTFGDLDISFQPAMTEISAQRTNHNLDLSGSHDVTSHVTIRIPIGHFLPFWGYRALKYLVEILSLSGILWFFYD